ncbi:MAG: hypothetical protein A2X45_19845 [Lentisphaerae bacterium GWF2_50_93]|nr:MAG: hypothetical protein A2X45_19845 [Lentisphaerae bacterium GWF2_50_93]
MITEVEKDIAFARKTLEGLFREKACIDRTLERMTKIEAGAIPGDKGRLSGLVQKCGNIEAAREFLIFLVFETYFEEDKDMSYFMGLLGHFEFLKESEAFSSLLPENQKKLLNLLGVQFDRVRSISELICKYIEPGGKTCLDIGCGIGQLSYLLAEKGMNVIGIDRNIRESTRIKEFLMQKYEYAMRVEFNEGNALGLPNFERKFDLITLADVVEHIDDKEKLFGEIEKVADTGSMIFMHTDNFNKTRLSLVVKRMLDALRLRNPLRYNIAWSGKSGGHTALVSAKDLSEILKRRKWVEVEYFYDKNPGSLLCPSLFSNGYILKGKRG